MNKKIWFFPLIIIIIFLLAGCGGGGGVSSSEYSGTKTKAAQIMADFEIAVENYNVVNMLGCLSIDDFSLTIRQGTHTSLPKDYTQLGIELVDDQANQIAWRKAPEDDINGHNYRLNLVLASASYSNTTSAGTYATQSFEVRERADGIPEKKTDQGMITWKIVENSGNWKAVEMIIDYQSFSGSGLSVLLVPSSSSGFGFTKLKL